MPTPDLLVTATLYIRNRDGHWVQCRALLDTCSSSNFITKELADSLNLKTQMCSLPINSIGGSQTTSTTFTSTMIESRNRKYSRSLSFFTIPQICDSVPDSYIDRHQLVIPKNISLADPMFHQPNKIDILIGSGPTLASFCVGQINLRPSSGHDLILQKTLFGWILGDKFWELEEVTPIRHLSSDELACHNSFVSNVSRTDDGRYVVGLPFNDKKSQLGNSYNQALRRLNSIEKRLKRDPSLRQQYEDFLREYLELGHMTAISDASSDDDGFFLPHHCVIKQTSGTTKLRVVFDGSSKTSTGLSLNDTLLIGPTIQDDLFSLLLRFRLHNYVLIGDVEKMYRQVLVRKEDRKYQKILWRNARGELEVYELNTVTYGTSSAPYLAIRALHQVVEDHGHNFPLAATVVKRDFYVDDLITGSDSIDEAIKLREQVQNLLQLGKFNIRQWSSNEPQILKGLPTTDINVHLSADPDKPIKTLGTYWNAREDKIHYTVSPIPSQAQITKRIVLSEISRIFDPLGLLGPVILLAKLIMQKLWQLKIDWDESLPASVQTEWVTYISELPSLNNISFPRKTIITNSSRIQLHGFCDASERAYGACLYLRSIDENSKAQTTLLCAKSRVAPLKTCSIPRLELCAAQLLSSLLTAVRNTIHINIDKIVLWSDSTIVIQWLNTSPHLLKQFIANRVADIQSNTKIGDWRHVRSHDNPADALSRGLLPSEFISADLWRYGPTWLMLTEPHWPILDLTLRTDVPELRKTLCFSTVIAKNELFYKYSTVTKLRRVIAYCLRMRITNTHKGDLSPEELEAANMRIIKLVKAETFSDDLRTLRQDKQVSSKSKLKSLSPFLDEDGIIHVGGRLKYSSVPLAQRHPVILPRSHYITELLIRDTHVHHLHTGVQATLYAMRQRYWLIDGKNQIRRVIRQCVQCFRAKPRTMEYIMGDLPKFRVNEVRPFTNVGIDYCGPFYIKERKFRNRTKVKVYVAVFICLTVKAIHLEVVSDMTTEAFIAALKRFIARRGLCKNIYSDNGSNFVGANSELQDLPSLLNTSEHQAKVTRHLTNIGIKWHFIPPHSPHFGGIWEAAVRSFKHHMRRVVGKELFTFEGLNTFVIEVEAILNSRPLTPISSDANDPIALTPGHFLLGDSLMSMPEHDLRGVPSNRLSSWQHIQKLKQDFWTRWHKEYLNELCMRNKWTRSHSNIAVDAIVLIKEDNTPPMQWALGRIIAVHPGQDGVVRAVTLKTTAGEIKRNVTKLAPLPIDKDTDDNKQ